MRYIEYFKYECDRCHVCILSLKQKEICTKCGFKWDLIDNFKVYYGKS